MLIHGADVFLGNSGGGGIPESSSAFCDAALEFLYIINDINYLLL